MKRLFVFFASFFKFKSSIKARIFVSFSLLTICLIILLSLFWYQKAVKDTTSTLINTVDKNIASSLTRIENIYDDIRGMHNTVIYETNNYNYIIHNNFSSPSQRWFNEYSRLYTTLRTMNVILSRNVASIGIYKSDGTTCITGTTGLQKRYIFFDTAGIVTEAGGNDIAFYTDKPNNSAEKIKKYFHIGKAVNADDEQKAMIITRISESVIQNILDEATYPGGFVLLVAPDGKLLYDSSPGENQPSKTAVLAFGTPDEPMMNKNFVAFTHESRSFGLTIISAISNAYIKDSYRTMQTQLLFIFLASILFVALFSMLLSNKIARELQILAKNMKLFGEGVMSSFNLISSKDEIGQLSKSFFEMTQQIESLLRNIKENERQKRIMELRVLQAQISPHFLYNSLNTINYLAMLQNSDNIHIVTSSLINLLHGAVNIDDVLINVTEEVKYIRNYINIQQYRFPYEIAVDYQIDPLVETCLVPKMILQPIVENAIIHGLSAKQIDAHLQIKVYALNNERLVIRVTDNGIGMNHEKINRIICEKSNREHLRFSGIGIGNVNNRIKLQFGEDYGVSIYSQENVFTTVEILLPTCTSEKNQA